MGRAWSWIRGVVGYAGFLVCLLVLNLVIGLVAFIILGPLRRLVVIAVYLAIAYGVLFVTVPIVAWYLPDRYVRRLPHSLYAGSRSGRSKDV